MFKNKTLFVVGAGASCEVNLPTGSQMAGIIGKLLNFDVGGEIRFGDHTAYYELPTTGDPHIYNVLFEHAKRRMVQFPQYLAAAKIISGSMPQAISIDNYIDNHAGDERIELCGKLAIAKSILDAENKSLLSLNGQRPKQQINFDLLHSTWYKYFFQTLHKDVNTQRLDSIFDNVSFIIFNYDRCIEHYLLHALINFYAIKHDVAVNILKNLNIIHPYGLVGNLPWQSETNNTDLSLEFGADLENVGFEKYLNIACGIKTFTQQISDANELAKLRQTVSEAETIVFLGFGFHQQNMSLIKPTEKCKAKRIMGTIRGTSDSDKEFIERQIFDLLGWTKRDLGLTGVVFELFKGDCCDLFNNFSRSIAG